MLGVEDTDRLGKWTSNYSPHFLTLAHTCAQTQHSHAKGANEETNVFNCIAMIFHWPGGFQISRNDQPYWKNVSICLVFIVPIGIRIFQFILFSVHIFAATGDLTQAAGGSLFRPNAYDLEKKLSRSQSWNKSTLCHDARVQFSTQAHEKSVTNSPPVGFNLWRWLRRPTDVILIFPLGQRTHDCPSKLSRGN